MPIGEASSSTLRARSARSPAAELSPHHEGRSAAIEGDWTMKPIPLERVMSEPPRSHPPGPDDPGERRRFERGLPDYHNPFGGIGGAAPARSALTLRLVLA